MRLITLNLVGLLLTGCAAQPVPPMLWSNNVTSSALVFDPPVTLIEPRLDLSRSVRGEAAFAGFEDVTTTYFYVRTADRQTTDFTDRFERQGYSAKVGSIRR